MILKTYDNFLSNEHLQKVYNFVYRSLYKIGWDDSQEPQHKAYPNIHSDFSKKDVDDIKILNPILQKIKLSKKQYDPDLEKGLGYLMGVTNKENT